MIPDTTTNNMNYRHFYGNLGAIYLYVNTLKKIIEQNKKRAEPLLCSYRYRHTLHWSTKGIHPLIAERSVTHAPIREEAPTCSFYD